jgi:hypothetical protein
LELFLALIIEKSSAVTAERGAKRVEVYHLYVLLSSNLSALLILVLNRKHAVENTEMLDFLKELVQDVPDPSAGGTVDLEAEGENKKKRGKGKRAATAVVGSTTNPDDPDPPAPPKRKRRKKKEILEAAAAATSSDANKMAEDGPTANAELEDHDYDGPAVPQRRRMFDEDTPMQDDRDEYDEDDSPSASAV